MTQSFVVPEPLRSPWLTYLYMGVGVGIAVSGLTAVTWDLVRGYIVTVAFVNSCVSFQVALVYGNVVYPRLSLQHKTEANSPSAYWFGSLGMLFLGAGLILGFIARSGEDPASPASLILIATAMTVLTIWGVVVLRALHRLGRGLDG